MNRKRCAIESHAWRSGCLSRNPGSCFERRRVAAICHSLHRRDRAPWALNKRRFARESRTWCLRRNEAPLRVFSTSCLEFFGSPGAARLVSFTGGRSWPRLSSPPPHSLRRYRFYSWSGGSLLESAVDFGSASGSRGVRASTATHHQRRDSEEVG